MLDNITQQADVESSKGDVMEISVDDNSVKGSMQPKFEQSGSQFFPQKSQNNENLGLKSEAMSEYDNPFQVHPGGATDDGRGATTTAAICTEGSETRTRAEITAGS